MTDFSSLLKSTITLLFERILLKSIGLISTIILAKILLPEEFGLIAFCAIILHFFNIMSVSGSDQYIAKAKKITNNMVNSAWTLDIILKSSIFFAIQIVAGPLTDFFNKPDAEIGIRLLALIPIIESLQNPGLFILKRNHDYKKITKNKILSKILSFLTVIFISSMTGSYISFVIADIIFWLTMTSLSYRITSHNPKLATTEIRNQFTFSKWILIKGVFGYTRAQIDNILISRYYTNSELGEYHLTKSTLLLIMDEAIRALTDPLIASYSGVEYKKLLKVRYKASLLSISLIITPICYIIYKNSHIIVELVLGKQWLFAGSILQACTPLVAISALGFVINQILTYENKIKTLFYWDVFSLFSILTTLLYSATFLSLEITEFAWLRTLIGLLILPVLIYILNRSVKIGYLKTIIIVYQPALLILSLDLTLTIYIGLKHNIITSAICVISYSFMVLGAGYITKNRSDTISYINSVTNGILRKWKKI